MVYKCKMCGGTLKVNENSSTAICEYCGSEQTVSTTTDEVITNLYNRANNLRLKCEFDKAEQVYEKIVESNDSEAEAHWGIVLCKYGIEYVEDPTTHKRIPTCHRTSYSSIISDPDYQAAIDYSDSYQQTLYEKEAREIDKIQKDTLSIVKNEKPFDIFICYKETDENGKRTLDSVLANDIYYQLTQEGFKVFYAAITLEDKLGQEYEPYIFAALNSSKIMLVVGSKPEYFNAVWVKNEWSRFLQLMKTDRSKLLIPCYKDMDAYDLPEEFSHLQAQDMSKIGFINDIVRGIKKLINNNNQNKAIKETLNTNNNNTNVKALIERMYLFLEDGNWNDADIYCEKVLDADPKNAEAYIGKLMIELQVKTRNQLKDVELPFDTSLNYSKAIRFGDEKLEKELKDYNKYINERNENNRLQDIYNKGLNLINNSNSEDSLRSAAEIFEQISGFKDADMLRKESIYLQAKIVMNTNKMKENERAIKLFETIIDYKDSKEKIENANINIEKIAISLKKQKKKKLLIIYLFIICGLVTYFLYSVVIPLYSYNKLLNVLKNDIDNEKYTEKFEELVNLNNQNIKDISIEMYENYKNQKFNNIEIGDSLYFGSYEQDNDITNGNEFVKWNVIDKTNDKVLVISEYVLDCNCFSEKKFNTWDESNVRTWLNNSFLNSAFNEIDLSIILESKVEANINPEYNVNLGKDTIDKIFLLSYEETEEYFTSEEEKKCVPTKYAISKGIIVSNSITKNGINTCPWLLRTPCGNQAAFMRISFDGSTYFHGGSSNYITFGIRPAMWININN